MGIIGKIKSIFKGRTAYGIDIYEPAEGKNETLIQIRHNRRFKEAITELIMAMAALNIPEVNDLLKKYNVALEENQDMSKHIVIDFPEKRWH